MADKKIITKVMVHPTELVSAQSRYYNDSDIGKRMTGKITTDIANSRHSSFFSSDKEVTTTGAILNTAGVSIIYAMIKNKTHDDVLLAFDGTNYKTKISKGDVFSSELNSSKLMFLNKYECIFFCLSYLFLKLSYLISPNLNPCLPILS